MEGNKKDKVVNMREVQKSRWTVASTTALIPAG